jgi:uncharacterized protein GlcG (DUF336 family)
VSKGWKCRDHIIWRRTHASAGSVRPARVAAQPWLSSVWNDREVTLRDRPTSRSASELRESLRSRKGGDGMAVTLAEANMIIQGSITKAEELNIKVSVAVCDAGGRLVAFNRMDGAIWASTLGCQGKAIASAAFGRASGELTERADTPIIRGIVAAEGGHMIPSQGAVPIVRNGTIEGGCGVGGGTGQEDEECARAGVAVLNLAGSNVDRR